MTTHKIILYLWTLTGHTFYCVGYQKFISFDNNLFKVIDLLNSRKKTKSNLCPVSFHCSSDLFKEFSFLCVFCAVCCWLWKKTTTTTEKRGKKIIIINSSSQSLECFQQLKVDTKESESFGYFLSSFYSLFCSSLVSSLFIYTDTTRVSVAFSNRTHSSRQFFERRVERNMKNVGNEEEIRSQSLNFTNTSVFVSFKNTKKWIYKGEEIIFHQFRQRRKKKCWQKKKSQLNIFMMWR